MFALRPVASRRSTAGRAETKRRRGDRAPSPLTAVSPPELHGRGGQARRSIDPGQRRSTGNRRFVRGGLDVVVANVRHGSGAAFRSGRERDAAVRAMAVRTTGRALLTAFLQRAVGAAVVSSVVQKPETHFCCNAGHPRELKRHKSDEQAQRDNEETTERGATLLDERVAFRSHRGRHAFTLRRLAMRWGW